MATSTTTFGSGRREAHDATAFYDRFSPPELSDDETVNRPPALIDKLGTGQIFVGDGADMSELPDNSVALVVTSPPYFVGKDYELAAGTDPDGVGRGEIPATYLDFLQMLGRVFAECRRVLEPGGRIAVNVANLGRKPYRSLSADVITILQDDLGLLLRGEILWEKSSASSGSCAWGSFARASNPVLRDVTERVIVASKGRFQRARTVAQRRKEGLPHRSTLTNDEFVDVTRDIWRIDAESATRVGHPAPFPVDLPRRLIELYTYEGDLVLDPFAGSGSALVAAARTGRIGVGYDLDADYAELAERRLSQELDRLADEAGAGAVAPQARALEEGKGMTVLVRRRLEEAGFTVDDKARHPSRVVDFAFLATGAKASFWVDVVGGFTTHRPGLERTEAVWRLLGRLSAAHAHTDGAPVIVMTSSLPKSGSTVDRALRSVGPEGPLFDAVEVFDQAGLERLAAYARSDSERPEVVAGFWDGEHQGVLNF